MTVYDLQIDWDGTTRSRYHSEALYSTEQKAKDAVEDILRKAAAGTGPKFYGGYEITPREVL